jgi:hypothetical protein
MSVIRDMVKVIVEKHPEWDNEQIAQEVQKLVPGAKTTAASVSSIKSNLKKMGELPELPRLGGPVIPTEPQGPSEEETDETDDEIKDRLNKRFAALERMTNAVIGGVMPSLIVSGPAGLGKSFNLRNALKEAHMDNDLYFDIISGSITAVGLYIALWNARDGGVVLLDDADDVFRDETALNLLKAALDSGETRVISWRKQANWLKEEGIDDRFVFNGQVVFLTNIDFESQVHSGRAGAVHFRALMDRSLYLSLTLRTLRDYMIRIEQVVYQGGMLRKEHHLDDDQVEEIMDYVRENKGRFYHLSLRLVHQIALCYKADQENWKADVEMTKMRG